MRQTWFITGASRGLGVEIARAALESGHRVAATSRDASAVERVLGRSQHLLALSLDVTTPGAAEEAARRAISHFGRVDVLVNNAGYALYGAVEEYTEDEFRQQMETNVFGMLAVTRAFLPALREQRSGHIFNLSSVAGFMGSPGASAYDASKFAIEGLSEALAKEVAPLGIKVTIVEPGLFRTEFLTKASSVFTSRTISDYDSTAGRTRRWMDDLNGNQAGDPRKLANAIVKLARLPKAPLRFTAGADAVKYLEESLRARQEELEQWRELSESLALDVPAVK